MRNRQTATDQDAAHVDSHCLVPHVQRNVGSGGIPALYFEIGHSRIVEQDIQATETLDRLGDRGFRSEEHTSELQSLMRISYAVFCLKKKKNLRHNDNTTKDK